MMAELAHARARWLSRLGLAVFYAAAGTLHLIWPQPFLRIMPDWVPGPDLVVAATGIAELLGAFGLMSGRWRRAAAIGLALYAVCVWPANFTHMLGDAGANRLYHTVRLPLQIPLIWWTLWAGGVIDWPLRRRN